MLNLVSIIAINSVLVIAENGGIIIRKVVLKNLASIFSHISDSYLENILLSLKRNKLLKTTRGPKGGYVLIKKPEKITLFDIVSCYQDFSCSSFYCPSSKIQSILNNIEELTITFLKGITVRDILDGKVHKHTVLRKRDFIQEEE